MHPVVRVPRVTDSSGSIYAYLATSTTGNHRTTPYEIETILSEEVERIDESEESSSDDLTTPLITGPRAGMPSSIPREDLWRSLSSQRHDRASNCHVSITINSTKSISPMHEKCSLLNPGSVFIGKQCMTIRRSTSSLMRNNEEWNVELVVQHVDWTSRRIFGIMKALDVPNANTAEITTMFEGEILSDLSDGQWRASGKTDIIYWTRLQPFKHMKGEALGNALSGHMQEIRQKYIFLRIKEVAFGDEKSREAGLTIAGFYYVSFNTQTGRWDSLYHDPSSTPYQRLSLRRQSRGIHAAFSFR